MNILVTGGTGFIGKPLVEALLSRGDTVTVLTRSIEKAQAVFSEKTPQFLTALSTLKDLNTFDAVIKILLHRVVRFFKSFAHNTLQ